MPEPSEESYSLSNHEPARNIGDFGVDMASDLLIHPRATLREGEQP